MHRLIYFVWILALVLTPSSTAVNAEEEGDLPEIIFSERERIWKLQERTGSLSTIITEGLSNAVAVDYDYEKKIVFWSDVRNKGIFRSSIYSNGTAERIVNEDVVTPDGLSVDWIYGNVYWTDTGKNTISVASLDGKMRKLLFSEDLDEPRAIVLNPLEGWMFWTDWGAHAKIERAGMDGTSRSTIVSKDIQVPNGLAIDFETRQLFWVDVQYHAIRSSNFDGSNVKEIYTSTSELGHPFAIDVFEDWLYWTDWRAHGIFKVHKATGLGVRTVNTRVHFFPMGVRVFHRKKQTKGIKYCGENDCLYLCLPAPAGIARSRNFTCVCPDGTDCTETGFTTTTRPTAGYSISYSTVTTEEMSTRFATPLLTEEEPSQDQLRSSSSDEILHEIRDSLTYCGKISGMIFGLLVLLIIAICLVGFSIYKQCLRGKITGLSFVNPVYKKQTEGQDRNLESSLESERTSDFLI